MIKELIAGFFIGVANIIPGVSGGTFALILGVYHRLLGFLNKLNAKSLANIWGFIRRKDIAGLKTWLQENDYWFMMRIASGAGVGIIGLSALMKYLLEYHFAPTYAFFFGLILVSLLIPLRLVKKWNISALLALLVGVLLTAGVSQAVDPAQKTIRKSEIYEQQWKEKNITGKQQMEQKSKNTEVSQSKALQWASKYNVNEYLMIFIAGVVAISAMVLPGISGSLVLILMGQYFVVVSALSSLHHLIPDDWLLLAIMGIGVVLGLLFFARLLEYALKHYENPMMGLLTGLVGGSLWALWPFKESINATIYRKGDMGIEQVPNALLHTNHNIIPSSDYIPAIILALLGMLVMGLFVKQEKQNP
jgi:putative membrane protein